MKMKHKVLTAATILAAMCAATSCSHKSGWSVEGAVDGLNGGKMALEGFNNGIWYVVDSIDVDGNGAFAYNSAAPAKYPEVMRLTLPGSGSIHFPVDSVDAITVHTTAASFASGARLGGTPAAVKMQQVDSVLREAQSRLGADGVLSDRATKRELTQYVIGDSSTVIAYYVLNKSVGGKPLFNPADSFDSRIYGAVAQNFDTYRPEDPRGAVIRRYYFEGRKALGLLPESQSRTIELDASGVIDIVRYDNKGVEHSLADVASKGDVVVLSFTSYTGDFSPAYNVILNDIYSRYHSQGLEIYQIAFDSDEAVWKQSAVNMPWITVWNSPVDGASPLISYNVGALPMTYIINRNGEIAERVEDPSNLDSELKKYL